MDRNTILGILLIFLILIGFSYFNKPSEKQIEAAKHKRDSLVLVQAEKEKEIAAAAKIASGKDSVNKVVLSDKVAAKDINDRKDKYGVFASESVGKEKFYVIENNLMKVTFSNKGGRIYSVELKNYKTDKGEPLILFYGDKSKFGLNFFSHSRSIQTESFFFTSSDTLPDQVLTGPEVKENKLGNEEFNKKNSVESKSIAMRLNAGDGQYLEYKYTLTYNSYLVGFDIVAQGLQNVIENNSGYLTFNWNVDVPRQERKSAYGEDRYTTVYYKYLDDKPNELSTSKSDSLSLKTKTQWISFKQLFFNSTIIADNAFLNADIKSKLTKEDPNFLGDFNADISLPYEGKESENINMKFYFGPNHYSTLKQYGLSLENLIYLGYAIVRPVNKYLIIPTFNFLRQYISNFGIIILLLTVFIKLLIFPFTFKSYHSQAKMKALKPEIDEINAKYGKEKAMEKQQATMALYKKAGVNPMGGCLPMVFQFPVLIAMFFFFPTSIELRHQSFLWAHDLSTYDSILNLPFNIPMYGSHVSLFCLLMTVTTIISTYLNSQTQSTDAMPGMKTMMYIMPVMFLFILNSYPAGLSYYYFLANVITIGQMYIFRLMIDENKIRAQIQINKKKPVSKSKFQQKLEDMSKQKGIQPRK